MIRMVSPGPQIVNRSSPALESPESGIPEGDAGLRKSYLRWLKWPFILSSASWNFLRSDSFSEGERRFEFEDIPGLRFCEGFEASRRAVFLEDVFDLFPSMLCLDLLNGFRLHRRHDSALCGSHGGGRGATSFFRI